MPTAKEQAILVAHRQEQLIGRLMRTLSDAQDLLRVSHTALAHNPPRVAVATERIEVSIDMLRLSIQDLLAERAALAMDALGGA